MSTNKKRVLITLLPEWERDLDILKKEDFYNKSQSEMFRYLIGLGLKVDKEIKNNNKLI